jgi:hypothetical protein
MLISKQKNNFLNFLKIISYIYFYSCQNNNNDDNATILQKRLEKLEENEKENLKDKLELSKLKSENFSLQNDNQS